MHFLDCHSIETMLRSVSAAIGRTDTELAAAIEGYDEALPAVRDPSAPADRMTVRQEQRTQRLAMIGISSPAANPA